MHYKKTMSIELLIIWVKLNKQLFTREMEYFYQGNEGKW